MSDRDPDETTPSTHQPYGHDPYSQPAQQSEPTQPFPPYDPQQGQVYGQQYGQQPYGQAPPPAWPQGGPGYQAAPPLHPSANTALVLGIVSLAGGLMCFLPLLAGPFAWVTGRRVKREIDAAPHQYGGASEAGAGMVLGIVSTVLLGLGLLLVALFVVLLVVGASTA